MSITFVCLLVGGISIPSNLSLNRNICSDSSESRVPRIPLNCSAFLIFNNPIGEVKGCLVNTTVTDLSTLAHQLSCVVLLPLGNVHQATTHHILYDHSLLSYQLVKIPVAMSRFLSFTDFFKDIVGCSHGRRNLFLFSRRILLVTRNIYRKREIILFGY